MSGLALNLTLAACIAAPSAPVLAAAAAPAPAARIEPPAHADCLPVEPARRPSAGAMEASRL
jgi:hypothetical protein